MISSTYHIGNVIVRLRNAHGISQERLAVDAGVDRRYLSDLENNRRNPSIDVVNRLAAYFDLSLSQFFALHDTISLSEIKERLCEADAEDAIVFENPAFEEAFAGISQDGRAIYEYQGMIASLISEGMQEDEAIEFIEYNTIRALPYMGEKAPIILYR